VEVEEGLFLTNLGEQPTNKQRRKRVSGASMPAIKKDGMRAGVLGYDTVKCSSLSP
jgi:hypothetical protein